VIFPPAMMMVALSMGGWLTGNTFAPVNAIVCALAAAATSVDTSSTGQTRTAGVT
jgi:hypothetical protein